MPSKGKRAKRKSKKEEGQVQTRRGNTFSKRIRSFFSSPVKLVRLIFGSPQQSPPNKPIQISSDPDNGVFPAALQAAKDRRLPCYFLFLGLSQSGKSTTISKLFNGERPKAETSDEKLFKIYRNESVGQNIGLNVVDTPGLLGKNTIEQDAEVITALTTFLKRELPARIPTVTFIVARLDDNRFEGEQSDFTRMLKTVHLAKKHITDDQNSNLVLLLTHTEKAKVQEGTESSVNPKILRYRDSLNKIFPSKPITVISVDNIRDNGISSDAPVKRYHDVIFDGLRGLASKREDLVLKELMSWFVGKSKRFSISFVQETHSVSALLPPRRGLITKTVKYLMDDEMREDLDSDSENEGPHRSYEPYFVMHHAPRRSRRSKQKTKMYQVTPMKMFTCIPPGSHIVLADKTVISVEMCLVGDKLLGLQAIPSVVTGMRIVNLGDEEFQEVSVGSIYCATKQDVAEESTKKSKFIYSYQNDSFRLVNAFKANIPEKTVTQNVFLLELDSDQGTVIIDGFPCYTQISRENI